MNAILALLLRLTNNYDNITFVIQSLTYFTHLAVFFKIDNFFLFKVEKKSSTLPCFFFFTNICMCKIGPVHLFAGAGVCVGALRVWNSILGCYLGSHLHSFSFLLSFMMITFALL